MASATLGCSPELAKGRLRAKLPQLRQALRGRVRGHHALLVRLALAHLEQLEQSIAELDTHIDRVLGPFAQARDRLDTITGVGKRAAETIIAEIGVDTSVFPTAGHLASWAHPMPGQQPHRRQAPLRHDHQGQPLAW
jgi:transposase